MARAINRLSARSVASLKQPGLHADGAGLYLEVKSSGSKSWTFVYRFGGKRRQLGFGSVLAVSLAQARDKAAEARSLLDRGIDPAVAKDGEEGPSFGNVANQLIDGLESGWRNAKHRQQWRNTLKTYAAAIWDKPVAKVDTNDLLKLLQPIWTAKPETASRVRGRIERVLDAAKARSLRDGENPARWRGHLAILLPARKIMAKRRHHPAMPFEQVAGFVAELRSRRSTAARALEFTILTAARTSETLKATWSEVDLDKKLWIVPSDRMKAGKEHRVPLSDAAIAVLKHMKFLGSDANAFVFPGTAKSKPLSNMSMEMLMRGMDVDDSTVHGFRSSFRDWAGEMTEVAREIAEAALAHSVGSEVERSYRRGDALEKRRVLMARWADYLAGKPTTPEVNPSGPTVRSQRANGASG